MSLKAHAVYNEKWLQTLIAEDPGLLGLGDLVVKDVERRQPRAGRLDLLLSDPETSTRYEVEIQLGPTDEAHIIRTIEYWDIEKGCYPQYEHVAVIIAEDITSRFLNVISLFNKAIPLIAVQIRALEVQGAITLHATTVLDLMTLGAEDDDEEESGQSVDRAYWMSRGPQTIKLADEIIDLVNDVTGDSLTANYKKPYIGLARNGVVDNLVILQPRKDHLRAAFRLPRSDEVEALIEDSGMSGVEFFPRWKRYRMRLTEADVADQRALLVELIRRAAGMPSPEE